MKTLLVTGFEPFEGHALNVSWEIARALDGERDAGVQWRARQLPCVFGRSLEALHEALDDCQPDWVLCLGQAEGRPDITLERIALNLRDARIPDNAGCQPRGEPIVAGAPLAYGSTLRLRALMDSLQVEGWPISISNTAGTFVCNEVFFGLQHRLIDLSISSGFVHLPLLPEQVRDPAATQARDDAPARAGVRTPSLPRDLQLRAIRRIGQLTLRLAGDP